MADVLLHGLNARGSQLHARRDEIVAKIFRFARVERTAAPACYRGRRFECETHFIERFQKEPHAMTNGRTFLLGQVNKVGGTLQ